jgi:hypothetical protein
MSSPYIEGKRRKGDVEGVKVDQRELGGDVAKDRHFF